MTIQERVDETALAMLSMTPEQREQCICDAFDQVLAKHSGLADIPPSIVALVAAVFQRIAEFERTVGTA